VVFLKIVAMWLMEKKDVWEGSGWVGELLGLDGMYGGWMDGSLVNG
jgi:hypothetical protein